MKSLRFFSSAIFLLLFITSCTSSDVTTANTLKVIIVGAGPAGVAAGTKLLEYGFTDFRIFEAEPRFGGRIHTIKFADNVIDLGAQWCHGEVHNVVYEAVKDLDLLASEADVHTNFTYVRSNGEQIEDSIQKRLTEIDAALRADDHDHDNDNENETALAALKRKYAKLLADPAYSDIDANIAAEFFEIFEKGECSYEAADSMAELPANGETDYETCDGDLLLSWKDKGYKSFLELLMKTKTHKHEYGVLENHLLLDKKVGSINWQRDDGKVLVTSVDGEEFLTEHVIVTVSLGVLKANHRALFQPELPLRKQHAIEHINFGTVNKIFIEFEQAFWPKNWTGLGLLWREEDLRKIRGTDKAFLEGLFGYHVVRAQPRILEGWVTGKFGREMENLPLDFVRNETVALLKSTLPYELTPVLNFTMTKWYTNPNFRGTYSYHSVEMRDSGAKPFDLEMPLNVTLAGCAEHEVVKCLKPVVLFAGEATNTEHYSTVHGAVETGWREAKRIADFYHLKI